MQLKFPMQLPDIGHHIVCNRSNIVRIEFRTRLYEKVIIEYTQTSISCFINQSYDR